MVMLMAVLLLFQSSTDSLNMRFVGNYPFGWYTTFASAPERNLLFVGSGGGVYIFNVTDPVHPSKISEKIHTSGWIDDLIYKDGLLYIADGPEGLRIWDVSDVSNLKELSSLSLSGWVSRMVISGNYLYAKVKNGFYIVDIQNPESPEEVTFYETKKGRYAIGVSGSYGYAYFPYTFTDSLKVIDFSDPKSPKEVGKIGIDETWYASVMLIKDSYLYLPSGHLWVIDISDPIHPKVVNNEIIPRSSDRIEISGSYLYTQGGKIIDISDPANPKEVAEFPFYPHLDYYPERLDLEVCRSHLYYGRVGSFKIIDIEDPTNPEEVGAYKTPPGTYSVALYKSYALIADNDDLRVIDVKDPTNPKEIAHYETDKWVWWVTVSGDYAYVGGEGLYIFDISTTPHPEEMGYCDIPGSNTYIMDIKIIPPYAYVVNYDDGLHIIDISDSKNPKWVGFYHAYSAYGLAISGAYAYVITTTEVEHPPNDHILAIDISDPFHPKKVGEYTFKGEEIPFGAEVDAIAIHDSLAYVVCGNIEDAHQKGCLWIINIKDPQNLKEIGHYEIEGGRAITISYPYAYIGTFYHGIRVMDISDPLNPKEVGFYSPSVLTPYYPPAYVREIIVSDSYIYAAQTSLGLQIYESFLEGMEEIRSSIFKSPNLSISPNPFKTVTSIKWQVAGEEPISLEVYNASGRLVRTLSRTQSQEPRAYTIEWKGDDDKGNPLPSGVYFCLLKMGDNLLKEKVILLK